MVVCVLVQDTDRKALAVTELKSTVESFKKKHLVAMQQQLPGERLPCRFLQLMNLCSLTVFKCLVENCHLPFCFHPV